MDAMRRAYVKGWALQGIRQGMTPRDAFEEGEREWRKHCEAERKLNELLDAMEATDAYERDMNNRLDRALGK